MRKQIIWPSIFFCCFFLCQNLIAQVKKVTVKGIILDGVTKEPLTGTTIGTPGKGLTQADANGNYSVVVDDGSTLVFTIVGYATQSIKLRPGQVTLNVNMASDTKLINETVIRGYVKRSREQTTGASYIITGKEVQDNPVGNVEQLLQGKVAGLNIQNNTGAPGMRGSVNIRGLSTIAVTGSGDNAFLQPTSPLYIIDGIPLTADQASQYGFDQQGSGVSPLSLIPQEDIASMEILKDATATALYGSRGAYGVILITTVRGKSKIPRVVYTSNYFVSKVPKLRSTLGGNAERAFKIAQINSYAQNNDKYLLTYTPFLSDSLNAYYNNSTNWQGIYYSDKFNTTQNVELDGGDDKFNYKTNLKYFSQSGLVANTGFQSYSVDMNMQFRPSKKLSFFGAVRSSLGKVQSGSGTGVLQTIVNNSGNRSTLLPGPSFLLATSDVLQTLDIRKSAGPKEVSVNMSANYELLPGLNLATSGNYDYTIDNTDSFLPAAANGQYAQIDNNYQYTSTLYNRNNISYTKSLGQHNLFLNLFNEIYVTNFQANYTRIFGSPNDQYEGPTGYDGRLTTGGGVLNTFTNLRTAAFAAAFTYDYKKKYIVDLTYRIDGSSANGQKDPYTKNPSIGFKWNLTKEDWIANSTSKWLDFADIRLTAGQNIYPVGTLQDIYGKYNPNGFYNNQPRVGIDLDEIPNPYLKSKNVIQYNVGFDAAFFNGKLDVTFDTYYKGVTNELFKNQLDNTLAFSNYQSNDAALSDYGYELSLTIRPLRKTSKFIWTVNVNGALNYDVLTKLPAQYNGQYIKINDPTALDITGQYIANRVGRNSLSNYLFINNGVYATTADVPVDPVTGLRLRNLFTNQGPLYSYQGGDAKLQDFNGDYVIDARDRQVSGNSQPLITGGLSNTLTYGNVSLNVYASYTAIRSIINASLAQRLLQLSDPFGNNTTDGPRSVPTSSDLNIWRGTGDASATYANVYNYAHERYVSNFRAEQTLFQENGSYFKINQITLSYVLPKTFVKRIGLNSIRPYFSASNVAIFTPYSGPNVENVNALGKDVNGAYPNPRTYTLGLTVQF
ncbi:SusC/RagA family TonB-linked outer membrane protein [Mucilaginibacter sp. UR6-11]|uniref:SusC/RagA family TonB-linked outer membrane protein n=1 Tax=Mucilaginibacter sp. UR6-11 TaxID=1435644 RepID=UPI001E39DBB1|nr:SusC/RagA family TonB-linked outer membrane protein [Mucilaginibacter sp. UR6-11]MCC8424882.1 SusC/RagA family TonB-linked outer membrane protein [Mucilaginibacter sp. UR6-11]